MDPRRWIDGALELSVVGSFTDVGYAIRRRMYAWNEPATDALRDRTVLITGPTSGLGRQATEDLAALGARLVLVARDAEKLDALAAELRSRTGEDRFRPIVADLGSLDSVNAAVADLVATEARIDVLVDNAGAMFPERRIGPDGIEATLAVLVVGPFALVSGLLPVLRRSEGARVIAVSSGGMYTQAVRLDDLQWAREDYSGPRAYARAKRIQVMLVREWARRLSASGIVVNAMHPGWADTPGLSASLPGFRSVMGPLLRTPAEGVDTLVWLAAAEEAGHTSGAFFHDRRPRPFDRAPFTRMGAAERRTLWQAIVDLANVEDPLPEG